MGISAEPPQVPQPAFNRDTLQQRLQAITQGSTEAWTYVIFWEYSVDAITGSSLLDWGDGNYKGCKEDHYSPVDKAELEHRKRVLCELNTIFYGSGSDSDTAWLNLIEAMRSFLNSTDVLGHKQEHRKLFLSQLTSLISSYATPTNNATSLDDRKLSSLLSAARCFKEDITDTQWFFLISMTQSFLGCGGLPGQALHADLSTWISDGLSSAPCERARTAYHFGLRTMVCIPVSSGVIELASTDTILKTAQSIPKILSLFNGVSNERAS